MILVVEEFLEQLLSILGETAPEVPDEIMRTQFLLAAVIYEALTTEELLRMVARLSHTDSLDWLIRVHRAIVVFYSFGRESDFGSGELLRLGLSCVVDFY